MRRRPRNAAIVGLVLSVPVTLLLASMLMTEADAFFVAVPGITLHVTAWWMVLGGGHAGLRWVALGHLAVHVITGLLVLFSLWAMVVFVGPVVLLAAAWRGARQPADESPLPALPDGPA